MDLLWKTLDHVEQRSKQALRDPMFALITTQDVCHHFVQVEVLHVVAVRVELLEGTVDPGQLLQCDRKQHTSWPKDLSRVMRHSGPSQLGVAIYRKPDLLVLLTHLLGHAALEGPGLRRLDRLGPIGVIQVHGHGARPGVLDLTATKTQLYASDLQLAMTWYLQIEACYARAMIMLRSLRPPRSHLRQSAGRSPPECTWTPAASWIPAGMQKSWLPRSIASDKDCCIP